jgi:hypothetical protein
MQNEIATDELAKLDTIEKLDHELLESDWSIEARAELMRKRLDLASVARRAAAAPPRPFSGGVLLTVPREVGCSDIMGKDGRTYKATTAADGRTVVDVPPAIFQMLLAGHHGKLWESLNQDPEIWRRMQPGLHLNAVA